MPSRAGAALILACVLALPGCRGGGDASGAYLAQDPGTVEMVQLVQTPDGHVTGQLSAARLDARDGSVQDINAPLAGVVAGRNITLQTNPGALLAAKETMTGTVDGDTLSLNAGAQGGALAVATFRRARVEDFQAAAQDLRRKAAEIAAEHQAETARQAARQQEADLAAQRAAAATAMDQVAARMHEIAVHVDERGDDIRKMRERYGAVDTRMQALLDKARAASGPNASFQRTLVSQEMFNEDGRSRMVDGALWTLQGAFDTSVNPVAEQAAKLAPICAAAPADAALVQACTRFAPAKKQFDAEVQKGRAQLQEVAALRDQQEARNQGYIQQVNDLR